MNLRNVSIKNKIIAIIQIVVFFSIMPCILLLAINDIRELKKGMIDNTRINAELVGEYCVTPLAFNDKSGAAEILKKLSAIPVMMNGYLYDNSGRLFASFNRNGESVSPLQLGQGQSEFSGNALHLVLPVKYKSERYGHIYMRASTEHLDRRIRKYILTMISFTAGALVISYVMALKLQSLLSRPILDLAIVTRKISEQGDYSIGVHRDGTDEISTLYKGFSEMLSQIRVREAELRNERNKLQKYLDTSAVMVVLITADRKVALVNRKGCELLGYPEEEIVGKNWFENFLPKRIRYTVLNAFDRLMSGNIEPVEYHENAILTKSGEERLIGWYNTVFKDETGEILASLSSGADITERKKIEEERQRLNNELTIKNQELGQVLYVTSHDLRAPLVNVLGFSRELDYSIQKLSSLIRESGLSAPIKEKALEIMEKEIAESQLYISSGIHKMDGLLTGLLRLSRVGRMDFRKRKLDMNKLLAEIAATFEFQTKETGTTIDIEALPECEGDEGQLNQAFSNLIGNALKYLDPLRKGLIRICGRRDDHSVVYTVEDNGIGIAPEHQKKIFEIFHQLNPDKDGEGLGLNIVQKIVDRHKGRMWLDSVPGKGSRFYIQLPL